MARLSEPPRLRGRPRHGPSARYDCWHSPGPDDRRFSRSRWEFVNFERAMIRLPDSKTGAKTLYLNAPTLTVLSELPRVEGNPFVIVGERKGAHLVNLQKPWGRIRKSAGMADVRLHDLRHSFARCRSGWHVAPDYWSSPRSFSAADHASLCAPRSRPFACCQRSHRGPNCWSTCHCLATGKDELTVGRALKERDQTRLGRQNEFKMGLRGLLVLASTAPGHQRIAGWPVAPALLFHSF